MARGRPEPAVDFSNYGEARRWFETQPREVCVAMAARAALRVLPLLAGAERVRNFAAAIVLPCFRATATPWAAAKYPAQGVELRAAAFRAADAAVAAAAAADAAFRAAAAAAAAAADAVADAAAAAVAAAAAAFRAAAAAAAAADAAFIERGGNAAALADRPLWPANPPAAIAAAWNRLSAVLLRAEEDWEVWIDWYADRLAGHRAADPELEIARLTLPEELWRDGPKAVNAEIKRLIEAARARQEAPAEPLPMPGPGPHFALGAGGTIDFAPPAGIDADGNNLGRIGQLLPPVRRAAERLVAALGSTNAYPELTADAAEYRAAIAGEAMRIAWGTVFGLGVMLENAAAAATRDIDDRLSPALEDNAQAALGALLALHGPLILATREGRELADAADRMTLTRDQQAALRAALTALAGRLRDDREVIQPAPGEFVEKAVQEIGQGPHAERGTVFGLATIKNVGITLVGAAAVAAAGLEVTASLGSAVGVSASWFGLESLKKSAIFTAGTQAIGSGLDRLVDVTRDQAELAWSQVIVRLNALVPFRRFVIANREPLRHIAANTTAMRWMTPYIDFIVRTDGPPGGAPPQ